MRFIFLSRTTSSYTVDQSPLLDARLHSLKYGLQAFVLVNSGVYEFVLEELDSVWGKL